MGEDSKGQGRDGRFAGLSVRFQADADFNFDIVRAVRLREPSIDFASATDSKLRGMPDFEVLERAAVAGRILVSHDCRTMPNHFRQRLGAGMGSPGLLVVGQDAPLALVADSIIVVWSLADPGDLRDQVYRLPSLVRHVFGR